MSGRVRLATIRSVSNHVLPFAVEAMEREFPDVDVEIHDGCNDYREVTAMVEAGTADIGITRAPVADDLVARPFIHDDYVVIAPDGIPLASPACWTELIKLPLIRSQLDGSSWIYEQCREQCRAAGLDLQAARGLTDPRGILALIARGLGYTVLPQLVAFPCPTGTQMLALPFPARRQLVAIAKPAVVRSRLVTTAMQRIVDRQVIMKSEAWARGAIGFA
jgi:DNA-binding transcriptional LysR family regulator